MNDTHESGCLPEELLSAHLDGDLEAGDVGRVASHLDGCERCTLALEQLRLLAIDLRGLGEVEPVPELWHRIRARHEERVQDSPSAWFRRQWMWSGLALAAATATLLFVLSPPEPPASKGLSADKAQALTQAYAAVAQAELTYIASIEELEKAVAEDLTAMSPEVRGAIEQGLAQIDATIAECREKLRQAPHDFGGHRLLLAAYQRKVDLLTELVERTI